MRNRNEDSIKNEKQHLFIKLENVSIIQNIHHIKQNFILNFLPNNFQKKVLIHVIIFTFFSFKI